MTAITRRGVALATLCSCASVLLFASAAAADRPDTPGTTELFHFDSTDVVETYGSPGGDFLLHFTRAGANAVPSVDADTSGVPDYVENLAILYDDVLSFYRDDLGFRAPLDDGAILDNGGDARFDVYLVDFGGGSDGSFRTDGCGLDGEPPGHCVGFMVQENDFVGYFYPSVDYANRVLSSHEFFHAVQAAYDADQGSVLAESTAVWATEAFDPTLDDFEGFVGGFLEHTDRPLDRGLSGPVDPFSYGAALFIRFLDERFDRSIVRMLWEACETQPWLPALDEILTTEYDSSFAEAFTELAAWDLHTGSYADPTIAYAEGDAYPPVTTTMVTLPYSTDTPLRAFYASARYFSGAPGGRDTVEAALVGDTEDLALILAVRQGNTVTVVDGASADAAGADEVFAVVVNTALSGDSRRPGLCIGSPDEVEACRASMAPMPDAGMMPDAEVDADVDGRVLDDGGADAAAMPPTSDGCGCTAPGRHAPTPMPFALALALLALRKARGR